MKPATPHKLVIVPEHTRRGKKVRQHIRRVPQNTIDVGGAYADAQNRQAVQRENRHLQRIQPPTGGSGGYSTVTSTGGISAVPW